MSLLQKKNFYRVIYVTAAFCGVHLLLLGIAVAQRDDQSLRQGFACLNQGIAAINANEWDKALQSLTEAEHIFIRFQDQTFLFQVFFHKGEVYRNLEKNEIADSLHSRALNCFQELDSLRQAPLPTMIPALYFGKSLVNSERNFTLAIQYGEKARNEFKNPADWDNFYHCVEYLNSYTGKEYL